jgi:uncharacterized protein (TIGR00369 family)
MQVTDTPGASFGSPFALYLGLRETGPGQVAITIKPELVNSIGLLLGPVGFALADYAMGAALRPEIAPGELMATLNIAMNFIQSADAGEVFCQARLDRRNRHLATLTSETHHEDGRLLSTAVGSFSIFEARD